MFEGHHNNKYYTRGGREQRSRRRCCAAALHIAIAAGCQLNALHMRADVDVAVFGSPTVCESLRVSCTPSPALFLSVYE